MEVKRICGLGISKHHEGPVHDTMFSQKSLEFLEDAVLAMHF